MSFPASTSLPHDEPHDDAAAASSLPVLQVNGGKGKAFQAYVVAYVVGPARSPMSSGQWLTPLYYVSLIAAKGQGTTLQGLWATLVGQQSSRLWLSDVGQVASASVPQLANAACPDDGGEVGEVSSRATGKETAEGVTSAARPEQHVPHPQTAMGVSAGSSTSEEEAAPVPVPVQRPAVTAAPDAVAQHSTPRLVFGCLEQIRQARPAVRTRRRARSADGMAVTAQPTLWDTATSQAEPLDTPPQSDRPAALYWSALEQATLQQGSLWE